MSTKGIVSNENGFQLKDVTKQAIMVLGYFLFRQRLEYKCKVNGCYYECVDERYSTKMYSLCGFIKKNVGGSKVFKCDNCSTNIDRDINPGRSMYLRSKYK